MVQLHGPALRVNRKRLLVINTMATVLFFALSAGAAEPAWSRLLHRLVITAVYVFSIGTTAAVVAPRVVARFSGRSRATQLIVHLATAAIVVAAGIGGVPALLLPLGLIDAGDYLAVAVPRQWPSYVWVALVVVMVAISLNEFVRRDLEARLTTKERDEAIAQRLAAEAQLASLESRVQPHFLFNALNSIAALIPEDPARAERMVWQVASLLRSSLDSGATRLVPLTEELRVVCDYLEIERVRFGDRLRYHVDVSDAARRVLVPPLSVQTLVENAVKYAVTPRCDGAMISLRAMCGNGCTRVEVHDDGPGFDNAAVSPGHGLALLRTRLDLLFGARAVLRIDSRPGKTAVAMEFHDSRVSA